MTAATQTSETAQAPETAGQLENHSLPQLLAEAWRDRRSGCLEIRRGQNKWQFQFVDGALLGLTTQPAQDGFAQSLEDAGSIGGVDRMKAEKLASERGCAEAAAVLSLGLLEAKAIYQALRTAMRHRICECFEWRQGVFEWAPPPPDTTASGQPFDVLKLIQEQLPMRWGLDRLFDILLPHSDEVVELTPNSRRVANQLGATGPMAQQMIDRLDGSTSIGLMLGESAGDPLAAATLWVLLTAGLVRPSSGASASAEAQYEFEVVVAPGLDSAANAGKASSEDASPEAGTANPKAEALRTEITDTHARLEELTHYSALGIEEDASAADIKRAYFKAAKKFHPDSLARLGLGELRDTAAHVFGRVAEAFETLSDATKRAAYDAGDSGRTEIDTARLAQAETSFRKGEILVKMGNFAGALEYLRPAVELWPEEPAYQAELGWALFRQSRSDATKAREHLEIACEQQPGNAQTLYRLGLVLGSLGETEASKDRILAARAIDPDISD
jgi:tetratricopeptide (TPR) repeat protein